ncbi:hypothetical protein BN1013_01849 [Candidatus Rubidus massiliensis]|nr:hypothetical protein BN1013_01849 [Candidatus Rubidus massiliensis]
MKKTFITGLVILLPLALTVAILLFLFNLLTQPFAGIIAFLLEKYNFFANGIFLLNKAQTHQVISQLMVLFSLFGITVALGVFARWFFVNYILLLGEKIFTQIPLVSPIYRTCKDVIKTIFKSKSKSFKQVVMVRFPNENTWAIGLVTKEEVQATDTNGTRSFVAVFVPTTPNPTSGFLLLLPQEDLVYLDMSVEDAFKYIISCGVIVSPLREIELNRLKVQEESGVL